MGHYNPYDQNDSRGRLQRQTSNVQVEQVEPNSKTNKQQFESITNHMKQISKLLKSILNNQDNHQINLLETQQVCKELSSTFSHASGLLWMAVELDSIGILLPPPPPNLPQPIEFARALIPRTVEKEILLPAPLPKLKPVPAEQEIITPVIKIKAKKQEKKREMEEVEILENPPKKKRGRPFAIDENGERINKKASSTQKPKVKKPNFDDNSLGVEVESEEDVKPSKGSQAAKDHIEVIFECLKVLLAERIGIPITSAEAFAQLIERGDISSSTSPISIGRILSSRSYAFHSDKGSTAKYTLLSQSNFPPSPSSIKKLKTKKVNAEKVDLVEEVEEESPLKLILPPLPTHYRTMEQHAYPTPSMNSISSTSAIKDFSDFDRESALITPRQSNYVSDSNGVNSRWNGVERNGNFGSFGQSFSAIKYQSEEEVAKQTQETITDLFNSRPAHLNFDLVPLEPLPTASRVSFAESLVKEDVRRQTSSPLSSGSPILSTSTASIIRDCTTAGSFDTNSHTNNRSNQIETFQEFQSQQFQKPSSNNINSTAKRGFKALLPKSNQFSSPTKPNSNQQILNEQFTPVRGLGEVMKMKDIQDGFGGREFEVLLDSDGQMQE